MRKFFAITLMSAMMIGLPASCSHSNVAKKSATRSMSKKIRENEKKTSRKQLVEAVDLFLAKSYPKSKLTGARIVEVHDLYPELDVLFILAQGIEESQLGTQGLGKKYNSVFNVGAFDGEGGKYMTRYKDPNDSIEPYARLVSQRYLTKGRTTGDLMKNYVDCYGRRYASNRRYERNISAIYKRLASTTEIDELNKKYRSL